MATFSVSARLRRFGRTLRTARVPPGYICSELTHTTNPATKEENMMNAIEPGIRVFAAAMLFAMGTALAQTYPSKPVRLIVPFAPGGGTDVAGRITGHFLGERLGVSVIVENRIGGNGAVGLEAAVRATPDGYTLLFSGADAIINLPLLRKSLPVDTLKDLVPLAQVGTADFVFAVNPKLPVNTIEELIALAKSKPGALSYSSGGTGTTSNIMGELLKLRTGIDMVHVPYKSGGLATIDTVGGHVPMISTSPMVILKQVQAGDLRALAVSGDVRSSLLPSVPTMIERGFKDFLVMTWFGVFGPKGLPEPLVRKLSEDIGAVAALPEFRQRAAVLGLGGGSLVREEFGRYIASEFARWREVIQDAKIKADD